MIGGGVRDLLLLEFDEILLLIDIDLVVDICCFKLVVNVLVVNLGKVL